LGSNTEAHEQYSRGLEEQPYGTEKHAQVAHQSLPRETWLVDSVLDQAHKEQIYDIESIGNLLYTTSMKNLKVWDLNTMQLISDIKAHTGVIK
jgi:hypothetical protein